MRKYKNNFMTDTKNSNMQSRKIYIPFDHCITEHNLFRVMPNTTVKNLKSSPYNAINF